MQQQQWRLQRKVVCLLSKQVTKVKLSLRAALIEAALFIGSGIY